MPMGLSIFSVPMRIIIPIIFKVKYLTCHVKCTKNKSGYFLSIQWSINWYIYTDFSETAT